MKNDLVMVDVTAKGLLWFRFKKNRTVFLLSPLGRLQVKWSDESEKRTLFRLIKELLVAKPNEKLLVRPLKQQTWIEYPVPNSFKLYWCDNITEYVLKTTLENREHEKIDEPSKVINGSPASGGFSKARENPRAETFTDKLVLVRETLEELRRELRFFREPTINEVALKSGCLDEDALKMGLGFGRWKAQSREEAKWIAERVINLAGWLRFKEAGELNPQLMALANNALDAASVAAVGRAHVILKNCPDLVPIPEIDVKELKWPDETRREWTKIFGGEPPAPQSWN